MYTVNNTNTFAQHTTHMSLHNTHTCLGGHCHNHTRQCSPSLCNPSLPTASAECCTQSPSCSSTTQCPRPCVTISARQSRTTWSFTQCQTWRHRPWHTCCGVCPSCSFMTRQFLMQRPRAFLRLRRHAMSLTLATLCMRLHAPTADSWMHCLRVRRGVQLCVHERHVLRV